jgi:hypothetical protein
LETAVLLGRRFGKRRSLKLTGQSTLALLRADARARLWKAPLTGDTSLMGSARATFDVPLALRTAKRLQKKRLQKNRLQKKRRRHHYDGNASVTNAVAATPKTITKR